MLKKLLLVGMVVFVATDMCHAISARNAAPAAVAYAEASTGGEDLVGFLSVSGQWPSSNPKQGFYAFNTSDGVGQLLGDITPGNGLWSYMYGDKIYTLLWDYVNNTYSLGINDRGTYELLDTQTASSSLSANDIAQDPTTGRLYGVFFGNRSAGQAAKIFGYIEPGTTKVVYVGDYDTPYSDELYNIMAMAASPEGEIYGMDMMSHLIKFDKETGATTDLGEIPEILCNFVGSAVWNNDTNKMLVLSTGFQKPTTYLYELDVKTLEYKLLTSFPNAENYTALYRPANYITTGCPEAITDFAAVFENGSRTGKLTFTCPKYNIGSDMDGMGALEYRVVRRGSVIASGTAPYGQKVEVPFTATENGTYQFSVYTVNGRGESARTPLKVFIGKDNPAAPVVTAVLTDRQHVSVSWEPVTVGGAGGFIDASKVTYTCYRKPDNKLICQDSESTSFIDEITWPEGENEVASYTYEVYARAESVYTSPKSTSNKIMVGGYVPTFREDFSSGREYDQDLKVYTFSWQKNWTIIDANEDGKTWEPVNPSLGKAAGCYNDRTNEMNDWLITPPLFLDAGKTYVFSFKCGNRYDTDRLEVLLGTDNTVEGFTQTLIPAFNVKDTKDSTSKSCNITVNESGIYFIGFHGISVGNTLYLTVTDVEVLAGAGDSAPGALTNYSVIPDSDYANSAAISFNMPKYDAEGNALEGSLTAIIKRDGTTVATFDNLSAGQLVEYTDQTPQHGTYNYDAAASNENGLGMTSTAEVYVGVRRPNQPQSVSAVEGDTDGEVVLN
ncbi:MAG: choice-of-anchor J domain-containing protein [Muribaculaceae bacterium]